MSVKLWLHTCNMVALLVQLGAFSSGQEHHTKVFQARLLFVISFNGLFYEPKLTHLTKVPIY
jgi:hypothetical protein